MIVANTAAYGGGIYCYDCSLTIGSNTIASNTAATGGGVYSRYAEPNFANNIVAFNSSGIATDNSSRIPVMESNCVYNPSGANYSGWEFAAGLGDISADPLFVDISAGDYHLTAGSPCINAGWNGAPNIGMEDIDGEPRISDSIIDIGADEYWPAGRDLGCQGLQGRCVCHRRSYSLGCV